MISTISMTIFKSKLLNYQRLIITIGSCFFLGTLTSIHWFMMIFREFGIVFWGDAHPRSCSIARPWAGKSRRRTGAWAVGISWQRFPFGFKLCILISQKKKGKRGILGNFLVCMLLVMILCWGSMFVPSCWCFFSWGFFLFLLTKKNLPCSWYFSLIFVGGDF